MDGVGLHVDSVSGGHSVENLDRFLHLPVLSARLYQAGESWSSWYKCGICDRLLDLSSTRYGVRDSHLKAIHVAGSLVRRRLSRAVAKRGWVPDAVC